jgi:glutathione synthase/RimK-type ligase-like ATP-grasp enzyme
VRVSLDRFGSVCLVTCAAVPDLTLDDQRLREALSARGWRVQVARWDDAGVAWADFRAVVLRSTWDYHHRPDEFLAWLALCETQGARLVNPAPLVRWNHHKSYLLDLEAQGLPIVPTALVRGADAVSLAGVMHRRGWEAAVAKPAVGGSAWGAFRIQGRPTAADRVRFAGLAARGDVLVQAFVPEIETAGELSFVFFGGELSHVVRKRPAAGDYRVQSELGGYAERVTPRPRLLERAHRVTAAIPGPWLYARVDAVELGGELLLMELELIEPELFLGLAPGAPRRLAELLGRLAKREALGGE